MVVSSVMFGGVHSPAGFFVAGASLNGVRGGDKRATTRVAPTGDVVEGGGRSYQGGLDSRFRGKTGGGGDFALTSILFQDGRGGKRKRRRWAPAFAGERGGYAGAREGEGAPSQSSPIEGEEVGRAAKVWEICL